MLEILFNNRNTERILFYLQGQRRVYAGQLVAAFSVSLFGIQKTLQKLERAGILVSKLEGNTRFYYYNPRYPFLKELQAFIEKAYTFLPTDKKEPYEKIVRTRPRRSGKPL